MFEKLVTSLRAAGLDASEGVCVAGNYYDGQDRGQYFPVVRVETDFSFPFKKMDAICRRRGLVYDWRTSWGCGVRLFTIWAPSDREEARRLDCIAAAFLGAFWAAIHEGGAAARENGAALAVEAGRRAVASWNAENGREA